MNKILLINIFGLFFIHNILCQTKKGIINNFDSPVISYGYPEYQTVLDLKDKGIVIQNPNYSSNKTKTPETLWYYNNNLDLIWEVVIDKKLPSFNYNFVVSDLDGNYIYHLDMGKGKYINKDKLSQLLVTQINKEGEKKVKLFENCKDFGYVRMIFSDNQYLYVLGLEHGNEINTLALIKSKVNMKSNENIILTKISHENLESTTTTLKLPKIEAEDFSTTTFWRYIGHEDNKIYLLSKEKNQTYNIIIVDSDGAILDNKKIILSLDNGFSVKASKNEKYFYGTPPLEDKDFFVGSGDGWTPSIGAYGDVKIDFENKHIYMYGLYGDEKYIGHFIHKFDFNGNLIWKKYKEASEAMLSSYFQNNGDLNKVMNFELINDNIILKLWYLKNYNVYYYTQKGELSNVYESTLDKENFKRINTIRRSNLVSNPNFPPISSSPASNYFKGNKENFYRYYNSSKGEIIINYNQKTKTLELLKF